MIDTCAIFPHPKGFPWRYSLKRLANLKLGVIVQEGASGHDPVQDARTCLDLVKYTLMNR